MVAHPFGGPWTEIKLDAVEYYLECYTAALTKARFDLWYIDAFAGTGERTEQRETGGIFTGEPLTVVTETLAGSARRALTVRPPFQHLIFNERNLERCRALETLKTEHRTRDIQVIAGEANAVLREIFSVQPWLSGAKGNARGIVFLDPYALQVEWQTPGMLANTRAVDVWYLFPLRDVTRQLARYRSGIGPKESRLDRVLSPRWRDLYSLPEPSDAPRQTSLFGDDEERNASQKQIEGWFKQQLETIFPFVSDPLPLLTGSTRQAFSLFLGVANPSGPAVRLAKHFHRYVMKNFAPGASRRKSSL
jgi:three-Cys-motif partner protein